MFLMPACQASEHLKKKLRACLMGMTHPHPPLGFDRNDLFLMWSGGMSTVPQTTVVLYLLLLLGFGVVSNDLPSSERRAIAVDG